MQTCSLLGVASLALAPGRLWGWPGPVGPGGQVGGTFSFAPGRAPPGPPSVPVPPDTAPAGVPWTTAPPDDGAPVGGRRKRKPPGASRCCRRTARTMITPRATACAELDRLLSVK